MGKILIRIGLIGLVAYAGWYLWSDAKTKTNEPEMVKIEEETKNPAKNEEDLTFKIKKGAQKEVVKKETKTTDKAASKTVAKHENPAKNDKQAKNTPKVEVENVISSSDSLTSNIYKFQEGNDSTALNVYFYDYGIDLSSKEISSGNVVFRAVNNGRLSHDLTLKDGNGQVDFGRVAPGETKFFKINLRNGEFEIFSQVRADKDHDMTEILVVK